MDSRALLATLGLLLATLATPAFSATDALQEVSDLIGRNQSRQAAELLSRHLQAHPDDGRAKLMQGIVLAELKKPEEAIAVFNGLIKQYPEWPEPYNNLAVLYARQGELERARQMLEASLRTHPSYSTAHDNLSTLYAAMASEAYGKALKTGSVSRPQPRLAMIQSPQSSRPTTIALASASKPLSAPPTMAAAIPVPATPAMTPSVQAAAQPSLKPSAPHKPAEPPKELSPRAAAPKPVEVPVKQPAEDAAVADIEATVQDWARAWSRQDVNKYLDFYADNFKPSKDQNRREWEQQRRSRIKAPKSIEVGISGIKTEVEGNRAKVSFKQHYRADRITKRTSKTLVLQKQGKRWQIVQELAG